MHWCASWLAVKSCWCSVLEATAGGSKSEAIQGDSTLQIRRIVNFSAESHVYVVKSNVFMH